MSGTASVLRQVVAVATIQGDRAPPALSIVQQRVALATRADQGPAGPVGPPGHDGGGVLQIPAGMALSGHRVVRVGPNGAVVYASCLSPGDAISVLGVTEGAADAGSPTNVVVSGDLLEPSWSWMPGQPVWLGASGFLVQLQPPVGDLRQIGIAITPTRIVVALGSPLIRTA